MERHFYLKQIQTAYTVNPACALLGPRQCGKTTLAHQYSTHLEDQQVHFFDLEDPTDLSKLENPKLAFQFLEGLIIIDEIQRRPDLFSTLRVLIDTYKKRFLILGSASQALIRQSSETLAGRITYLELNPFSLFEVEDISKLWVRGGFPLSYLANSNNQSLAWRKEYVRTYLEKDVRDFGFSIAPQALRRFWMMLAHYHGQIFNASEIGRSMDVSHKTIIHYLDILTGTFMVRRLSPWFENLSKRQIKSPKIFFRDSGILHTLLGIEDQFQLLNHPKLGASWEGFAMEQVIRVLNAESEDCYFWSTQSGAELELLIVQYGKKMGFEFKYTDAPKITKSMHVALEDLKLDQITLIIPGKHHFWLSEQVEVWGIEDFIHHQYSK